MVMVFFVGANLKNFRVFFTKKNLSKSERPFVVFSEPC